MKKAILSLIVIIMFLTSCSSGGPHMFNKFFDNSREVANKRFEQVLDAIKNRDESALEKLFSKKSISEVNDLNSNLVKLYDFFKGDFMTYDDWGGPNISDGLNDDGTGRNWKSMQSTYDVTTSEGGFRFAIKEFTKDTADSDNIGICSLYIINAKDTDEKFAYWGDGKWTPGINIVIPDEDNS